MTMNIFKRSTSFVTTTLDSVEQTLTPLGKAAADGSKIIAVNMRAELYDTFITSKAATEELCTANNTTVDELDLQLALYLK